MPSEKLVGHCFILVHILLYESIWEFLLADIRSMKKKLERWQERSVSHMYRCRLPLCQWQGLYPVDLLVSFWLLLPPLCCRCCRDEPIKQCRCGVEDAPRRRAIPTGFVWSWLIFDVYGSAKMTLAFFFSFCALTEVNVQPSLLFLTATVWPDWRWMLGKAASQCSKWFFIFPLAPVSLSESPSVFRSRLKTSWFHESFPQRLFWYLTQCVVRFSQVFLKILCNSWTFLRFFQLCFSRSFPRST